ncbi:MAG: TonB-dependent siderophore receptor [Aphanocapsa lilacina HA4352-LM1]|nr:TonB-dependent siderophore receptor [Aphanocapsa lilacina HA4352-LM1]
MSALRPFVVCGCLGLLVAPAVLAGEGAPRLSQLERPSTEAAPLLGQAVPEPQPAAAPPPGDAEDLDEVTVTGTSTYRRSRSSTATKTDTPILDTPQSVQVIPRQVIEDQGAVRVREALRNVSGVYLAGDASGRFEIYNLRGFTASTFTNAFSANVFESLVFPESANIERVEVLKGPSSVLFGRAEPSGVINFVTKKPLDRPYAALGFTAGSYDFYRTTVDLSGPLTAEGNLAYRLNAVYEDANNFRGNQARRVFFSPVVVWKASPDTTLTFEVEHYRDNRPLDSGIPAVGTGIAPIPYSRNFYGPERLVVSNLTRVTALVEHRFAENLTMRTGGRYTSWFQNYPRDFVSPVSLLEDNRSLSVLIGNTPALRESTTFQNDLVWKPRTGSVDHTVLFGLELGKFTNAVTFSSRGEAGVIDIFQPPPYALAVNPLLPVSSSFTPTNSFGVYLQDQVSFSESFKLVLGGRYDTVSAPLTNLLTGSVSPSEGQAFSPRVGLLYKPAPEVSLFANFNQSFAPTTGVSIAGTPFVPTRGSGYEVGAKADLLAGRLFANLALYKIARTNVLTADPTSPSFSIQVGEQESQGVEFDITGEILPGWNVIATYAYTDAKISRDNTFAVGNRLPTAPLHGGSFWSSYRAPDGPLEGWGIGAGVFVVGERFGDLTNSYVAPGYTRVDAALYYRRGWLNAAINFKNLLDARYIEASASRLFNSPGAPFTVQGTVEVRF